MVAIIVVSLLCLAQKGTKVGLLPTGGFQIGGLVVVGRLPIYPLQEAGVQNQIQTTNSGLPRIGQSGYFDRSCNTSQPQAALMTWRPIASGSPPKPAERKPPPAPELCPVLLAKEKTLSRGSFLRPPKHTTTPPPKKNTTKTDLF